MKVIIAGSRTISDYNLVYKAIEKSGFNITEVVSGGARGVDKLGELWAKRNHVPVKLFPAEWDKYGKRAGLIRNIQMAKYVGKDGGLVAITNGSSGTAHMIDISTKLGLLIHICFVGGE